MTFKYIIFYTIIGLNNINMKGQDTIQKIEDDILYVSGVDAFDGTPVLDIKPN